MHQRFSLQKHSARFGRRDRKTSPVEQYMQSSTLPRFPPLFISWKYWMRDTHYSVPLLTISCIIISRRDWNKTPRVPGSGPGHPDFFSSITAYLRKGDLGGGARRPHQNPGPGPPPSPSSPRPPWGRVQSGRRARQLRVPGARESA